MECIILDYKNKIKYPVGCLVRFEGFLCEIKSRSFNKNKNGYWVYKVEKLSEL